MLRNGIFRSIFIHSYSFIHRCNILHFACYNLVLCGQCGKAVVGAAGPLAGSTGGLAVGAQVWQWGARGAAPGRSCQIRLPAAAPGSLGTSLLFAFSFCPAVKHSSWLIRAAAGSAGTKRQSFSLCLSSAWGARLHEHADPDSWSLSLGSTKAKMSWEFAISRSFFPHL